MPKLSEIHIHDFAIDEDQLVVLPNIGNSTIFTAHVVWENLEGTLDAEVIMQGSNINPARTDKFVDLGIKKTITTATDEKGLTDTSFPYVHGATKIKKNGVTGGKMVIVLIAKER